MKNITTYYSSRKNIFVWLTVLLSLFSAVTRIIAFGDAGSAGFSVVVVYITLPLVANLFISIRLPWRCGEMYYVTVGPTVLLAIYFGWRVCELGVNVAMTACCLLLCVMQCLFFVLTYTGKLKSQIPALIFYVLPIAFYLDPDCVRLLTVYLIRYKSLVYTDLSAWLSIICIILASKRMPAPKEGDPYRKKWGDRMDGRRVHDMSPMVNLVAYFLPNRVGSTNYIQDSFEITNAERYIHEKRREGMKHFGMTHLFLAAYVRAVTEYPALNRFIAGQKIYHRYDIQCSMVIKKDMNADSPETTIKAHFMPGDTAREVYEKYDALVQDVKATEELNNGFDGMTKLLYRIPSILLAFIIQFLRCLDYFALLPVELSEFSPFHGSMFITSMGSLGIRPIWHHLYDFGNISQFCAFGAKRSEKSIDAEGNEIVKKYVDFTWATDERVCDGFYYAMVLKKMKSYLMHPEILDEVPEEIKEDID